MNAILNDQKTLQAIKRVNQAIEDIKQGKMVVMVDDEDRENEGDIVYAASLSTPAKVNFMASHAKGLICVSLTKEIAGRLHLQPMVNTNNSSYETAFTVSVDAKNATTGISALERDMTIKLLSDYTSKPTDFVKPGHIFPLIAKDGGVLTRTGHTEGSVDLCLLAELPESAVICEIMKEDGTMARRVDLDIFCEKHTMNMVYISDLVEYRMINELLIELDSVSTVDFMGSSVQKYLFSDHNHQQHSVYVFGDIKEKACVKFHNILPDNELLSDTKKYTHLMKSIDYLKIYNGIIVFMNSYADTMDNVREYGIGAQILKYLGIKEIELISDNSTKEFIGISGFNLEIIAYIKLEN